MLRARRDVSGTEFAVRTLLYGTWRWKKDVVTPKRLLGAPGAILRSNLDAMLRVRMRGIREGGGRVDGKALRG